MSQVWSTETIEPKERFAWWREVVNATYFAMTPEQSDGELPFHAHLTASAVGPYGLTRLVATAHRVNRKGPEIARAAGNSYFVCRQFKHDSTFELEGGETPLTPGNLIFYDSDLPLSINTAAPYDQSTLIIPKSMMDPLLAKPGEAKVRSILTDKGVGAIVARFLDAVTEEVSAIDLAAAEAVLHNFCGLLAIAQGISPHMAELGQGAVRSARLVEARTYIAQHLTEAALTPAKVASAIGISVRQLHLLFEPTGVTFSQYVMGARINLSRRILLDPASQHRTVTDIAFACGFHNLTTFYSGFRRAFDTTPDDMRRRKA